MLTCFQKDVQLPRYGHNRGPTEPLDYFGPLLASFENLQHLDLSDGPRDKAGDHDYLMDPDDLLNTIKNPSRLKSLKLPRHLSSELLQLNTLTGLQKLNAPFAALTHENAETFVELPSSLQHLIIVNANLGTCTCIVDLLQEKSGEGRCRTLSRIEMYVARTVGDRSLNYLEGGFLFPGLQDLGEVTNVELTIGRDGRS